jgi:hypothetical protein
MNFQGNKAFVSLQEYLLEIWGWYIFRNENPYINL